MTNKQKNILLIIAGIVLASTALFLCFSETGIAWQVKYLATFQRTTATISDASLDYHPRGRATSTQYDLNLTEHYTVNGKEYTENVLYKSFHSYEEDEGKQYVKAFTKEFIDTGDKIEVFYNPDRPSEAIARLEDEQHPFLIILLMLTVFISIILITAGGVELSSKEPEKSQTAIT